MVFSRNHLNSSAPKTDAAFWSIFLKRPRCSFLYVNDLLVLIWEVHCCNRRERLLPSRFLVLQAHLNVFDFSYLVLRNILHQRRQLHLVLPRRDDHWGIDLVSQPLMGDVIILGVDILADLSLSKNFDSDFEVRSVITLRRNCIRICHVSQGLRGVAAFFIFSINANNCEFSSNEGYAYSMTRTTIQIQRTRKCGRSHLMNRTKNGYEICKKYLLNILNKLRNTHKKSKKYQINI